MSTVKQDSSSTKNTQDWPWWPLLPLYPYGKKRTLFKELIPNQIWSFEQLQGLYYVAVPVRLTVIKVSGGLLLFNPLPPTKELLRDLIQKKIILGIATNDLEESAHHQLRITDIHNFFSNIYGCDSGYGSKPQTGMQIDFINTTNLEPSWIMMVGDSIADMISGKKSGMISVGVLTGPAIKKDLKPYSDIILRSICEIPRYLDY